MLDIETGTGPDSAIRSTRARPGLISSAELGLAGNVGPVFMGGFVRRLYGQVVPEQSVPPHGLFVGLIFGVHIPIGDRVPR